MCSSGRRRPVCTGCRRNTDGVNAADACVLQRLAVRTRIVFIVLHTAGDSAALDVVYSIVSDARDALEMPNNTLDLAVVTRPQRRNKGGSR